MDFLNDIKEKTILVVPSDVKDKVLEYADNLSSLVQFKIYSLNEIKKYLCFDYDVDAILYLMEKYNYGYEIAKNYIENLYYIEDIDYSEDKLIFLRNLKKELDSNNLLIYNNMFLNSYKNVPFIVFGYPYLDSFSKKLLSNFNYKIIENNPINKTNYVYKFVTLEDEILFVVNKIIELINNGVEVNNIYLTNLDSDYNNEINRIFKLFNIPIDLDNSSSLMSTTFGKKTFEYLKDSRSFSQTVAFMKEFDLSNEFVQNIFNSVLNILNKYNELNYSMDVIIDAIEYELSNKSINNKHLDNMVRIGNINSFYTDKDYVFLLGFNQGSVPKVIKDEEYISDKLKPIVGLDSVNEINKLERINTIVNIKSIKNIIISYKTNYLDNEYYPSNYINSEDFSIIDNYELKTDYSLLYSKLYLGKMLDNLIKYDDKNLKLPLYFNSLKLDYMTYDNSFKGLKKSALYKWLDNKLVLAYSNIESFYECQFKYYLTYILNLNKYEESFDALIGSLFHYVLSHVYDSNFDLDRDYDYYLKDKEFSNKEKFYLDKLREELRFICGRVKDFYNDTELKDFFTERKLFVDKSTDIEVIFKGFVDKIMYKETEDKTLVAVIDYKTGEAEIDIYDSIHGLGMQLLVYLYLISKSDLFNNYAFVGFYLQRILDKEINIEKNKTYLEIKNANLRMFGYSTDDQLVLQKFDPSYENSIYIKGMKTLKSGEFAQYAKVINKDIIEKLIILVDKKIDEARDKILNGDFKINPKRFSGDKDIKGCLFCKYRDICFRKNEDIVYLKKYKDLSFLEEGDING